MRASTRVLATAAVVLAFQLLCLTCSAGENDAGKGENLFAFVGQKISLTEQKDPPCKSCIIRDAHYVANYQVLDRVYGSYGPDTITFDVYDHYGLPAFSRYETVLLFVSRRPDGTWVHEKYQFYDLHKGVDDQWYGCGNPYGPSAHPNGTVRARPVQFPEPVSYPLDGLSSERINLFYPAEYFELRDGRAYCLLGAPVADLFKAKKETVFAARGIFK